MIELAQRPDGAEDRAPRKATRLLLVDDVEGNLAALEGVLARPGVELVRARSGPEALERLLVEDVAVALIDVHMPGMDGFELAELMRGSPRTRHIPIVFITAGMRDAGRVFRGYEAGAVDFLYKPIDARVLRSKIEVFVELQQQKEQLAEHVALLEEALRYNEVFLAVLAHDLRNPLGAILSSAEMIRKNCGEERARGHAERVARSAARMERLIEQLIDVARARNGGGVPVQPVPSDLRELLARAVQEIEAAAGDRAPSVALEGDPSGCWDADRLMQVLSNLLGNAVRHGDPGQPVTVRVDGTGEDEVLVSIHNGGAIPPDLLPHIFEPFRSGASGRARRTKGGLGLGLYIARLMTEAHGGTLRARSSAEGGTTFEVRLPRRAPEPPGSSITGRAPEVPPRVPEAPG
jgi:signal transduction histidine kinase